MKRYQDSIILKELSLYGYHGIFPEEKKMGQLFLVSLELFLDLNKAGTTDSLEDTVDYAAVYEIIKEVMEGTSFNLMETLAENIAERVLKYPVQGVIVEIKKPSPPVPVPLAYMGVKICRGELK